MNLVVLNLVVLMVIYLLIMNFIVKTVMNLLVMIVLNLVVIMVMNVVVYEGYESGGYDEMVNITFSPLEGCYIICYKRVQTSLLITPVGRLLHSSNSSSDSSADTNHSLF